jgi:hypothetical protein
MTSSACPCRATGARNTGGKRQSPSRQRHAGRTKLGAATKWSVAHARRRSVGSVGNFRFVASIAMRRQSRSSFRRGLTLQISNAGARAQPRPAFVWAPCPRLSGTVSRACSRAPGQNDRRGSPAHSRARPADQSTVAPAHRDSVWAQTGLSADALVGTAARADASVDWRQWWQAARAQRTRAASLVHWRFCGIPPYVERGGFFASDQCRFPSSSKS